MSHIKNEVKTNKSGGGLAGGLKHFSALTFFVTFLCLPARSRSGRGRSRQKSKKRAQSDL